MKSQRTLTIWQRIACQAAVGMVAVRSVIMCVALGTSTAFACDLPAGTRATSAMSAEITVAHLDALYPYRDDSDVARHLESSLDDARHEYGENCNVLWRVSRYRCWQADRADTGEVDRRRAEEAWDLGKSAADKCPNAPEGHLYAAFGIGLYAESVGFFRAVGQGLRGEFDRHSDRALELDAEVEFGAPHVAKGRFWQRLPAGWRDLDEARRHFEVCLSSHPENLRAALYLAEVLGQQGRAAEAKAVLASVRTANVDYDPPEVQRIKRRALMALREIH